MLVCMCVVYNEAPLIFASPLLLFFGPLTSASLSLSFFRYIYIYIFSPCLYEAHLLPDRSPAQFPSSSPLFFVGGPFFLVVSLLHTDGTKRYRCSLSLHENSRKVYMYTYTCIARRLLRIIRALSSIYNTYTQCIKNHDEKCIWISRLFAYPRFHLFASAFSLCPVLHHRRAAAPSRR